MEPFIGEIKFFAGNFAPRGWQFCNGQLLNVSQNSALFQVIGTIYGGDGTTTFTLPDLRGRVPVHPGTGTGLPTITLGQEFGNHETMLTTDNLPSHNHQLNAVSQRGTTPDPTGGVLGNAGRNDKEFTTSTPDVQMSNVAVGNTGNDTPFSNQPPSFGMNAIIAIQGVFPPRN